MTKIFLLFHANAGYYVSDGIFSYEKSDAFRFNQEHEALAIIPTIILEGYSQIETYYYLYL